RRVHPPWRTRGNRRRGAVGARREARPARPLGRAGRDRRRRRVPRLRPRLVRERGAARRRRGLPSRLVTRDAIAAERDRITEEYRELLPETARQAFDEALALCRTVFPFVENHNFYIIRCANSGPG